MPKFQFISVSIRGWFQIWSNLSVAVQCKTQHDVIRGNELVWYEYFYFIHDGLVQDCNVGVTTALCWTIDMHQANSNHHAVSNQPLLEPRLTRTKPEVRLPN